MMDRQSPTDLVLALVRVINGNDPCIAAREILDPTVEIHMDKAVYRGIDVWYKWINLIRNHGRVSDLGVTDCKVWCDVHEPGIVHLSARWTGTVRCNPVESVRRAEARYLVLNGRIAKIWTHRSNYEFIFGRWIKYSLCYMIFLAWAVAYLSALSLYRKIFSLVDVSSADGGQRLSG